MKFCVEVHDGITGIRALEREWLGLLTGRSWHPFERPEFYAAMALSDFARGGDLKFFAVRSGSNLRAVCPVIRWEPWASSRPAWVHRPSRFAHWSLPDNDQLPISGPCIAVGVNTEAILGVVLRQLAKDRRCNKVIFPGLVPVAGQKIWQFFPRWATRVHDVGCYEIFFGKSVSNAYSQMPKSLKKSLGRAEAAFVALDDATFEVGNPKEWESDFCDFLAVEGSGWKGLAGTAIVKSPELENFYRQLACEFGRAGLLRINRLVVAGKVAAAHFAVVGSGRLFILKSGYDESYYKFSPGNLLRFKALLVGLGSGEYEALNVVGTPSWCLSWKPRLVSLCAAEVFLPNAAGLFSKAYSGASSILRRIKRQE